LVSIGHAVEVGGSLAESGEKHWDVLVVGAGVIGLSTAYHIKEKNPNLSVLVMDRSAAPGQGDTAKSMAALRDTFTSDVNRLLARSTIDFYKHVQLDLGFNLNLNLIGYLWLLTEAEFAAYEKVADEMRKQGIRLKVFEREELATLIPDIVLDPSSEQSKLIGLESVHKGVFGIDCGTVSPELIVNFYENEFRKLGGEFEFGTEVKGLRLGAKNSLGLPGEPFAWQERIFKEVETNRGSISADTIVLAAGVHTPLLLDPLGIDCMIKPQKNQIFQVRSQSLDRLLNTKGFNEKDTIPFTILPKGGVYFRPVPGERSFWVSSAAGIGRAFKMEEEPTAEDTHYTYDIYPILSEYFPCFANLRPINSWAGFYDVNSLDHTPIITRVNNLIIATGLSGSGIMKADAVGRMAAAIFEGEGEAKLYDGSKISNERLGLTNRAVPKEQFVI
jgi:FAD-dependent oxidoreductase domain-containing protein 1